MWRYLKVDQTLRTMLAIETRSLIFFYTIQWSQEVDLFSCLLWCCLKVESTLAQILLGLLLLKPLQITQVLIAPLFFLHLLRKFWVLGKRTELSYRNVADEILVKLFVFDPTHGTGAKKYMRWHLWPNSIGLLRKFQQALSFLHWFRVPYKRQTFNIEINGHLSYMYQV